MPKNQTYVNDIALNMSEKSNDIMLSMRGIQLNFGKICVLDDINLNIHRGQIVSIIGPNGAGKTSLLNCINGFYHPERGDIYFLGQKITHLPTHRRAKLGIARTFQNIELFAGLNVLDNLMAARHIYLRPGVFSSSFSSHWSTKKN